MAEPSRGEVWRVNLAPVRGHEQTGTPALIVSVDEFNHGPAGLVVIIPLTTKAKGIPFHVELRPQESGLDHISYIKCEDVRSVSKERLDKRLGRASAAALSAAEDRLRILLGL